MTTTWQISYFRALFHKLDETAHPDTLRHTLKLNIWTSQTQRDCTKLYKLTHLHTADWTNCKSTLIPQIHWSHKSEAAHLCILTPQIGQKKTASQTVKLQISKTLNAKLQSQTVRNQRSRPQTEQNAPQTTHACTSPHCKLYELQISTHQMHISTPQAVQNCKSWHHKIQNCTSWQRRLTGAKNTHQINDMFNSDVTFCTLAMPNPWETFKNYFWPNTRTKLS